MDSIESNVTTIYNRINNNNPPSTLNIVTISRLSPRVTWPLVFRLPNAMRKVKKIGIDSINLKTGQTTHYETPGDPGNYSKLGFTRNLFLST